MMFPMLQTGRVYKVRTINCNEVEIEVVPQFIPEMPPPKMKKRKERDLPRITFGDEEVCKGKQLCL
jgi:hypothetical protein